MSNYHVLQGNDSGKSYGVVFHIPIPSVTNRVGVNYRTAISQGEAQTSVVPSITTAEQTKITNGEIYEHIESYRTHSSHTLADDRARLDARYNALVVEQRDKLQRKYTYYGYNRDVA